MRLASAFATLWSRLIRDAPVSGPGRVPPEVERKRFLIGKKYLRGDGIEIGALNAPLRLPWRARVKYVDRIGLAELRQHYPELAQIQLAPVDVIDDGEALATIAAQSLDFIIANHMLEHCENPLGAMRAHFSKLRPGGVVYYAVPDKRFTFDRDRPLSEFEHLVADDHDGPEPSRLSHYAEYVRLVDKVPEGPEFQKRFDYLVGIRYSIHFHVWDEPSFHAFLDRARSHLGIAFRVEVLERNDFEVIAVLRKPSGPVIPRTPTGRAWFVLIS